MRPPSAKSFISLVLLTMLQSTGSEAAPRGNARIGKSKSKLPEASGESSLAGAESDAKPATLSTGFFEAIETNLLEQIKLHLALPRLCNPRMC
jgi:hypothetical protein